MNNDLDKNQDINRVRLLYLLYTMNMPMSNSQLAEFAAETEFMSYFALRDHIIGLCESGLLEESKMNNQTYYAITEEGERILSIFKKSKLSEDDCNAINYYISKNKKKIKAETEITANWFYDPDSNFIVKCGIYEGNATVMEVNVSVVDRDVAEHICRKWKAHSSEIFEKFFNELSGDFISSNDVDDIKEA